MNRTILCGLTAEEIWKTIQPGGFNPDHARTIANHIYKKGSDDFSKISNISAKLKRYLADVVQPGLFPPQLSETSEDGTVKYLFRTPDGKQFETVLIPDDKRNTICISTQSGCRMGCPFCMTGKYGFHGNLTTAEILNQIISIPVTRKITHVVFMGMGEPMDNLENVLKACNIITAEWGMAIGRKNVTVSTVGITGAIQQFLESSDCNLALSLYSPFSEERAKLIPAEKKYPVKEIFDMMKYFPVKKGRRLTITYVMIDGANDTDIHLNGLITMLKGSPVRVNLLKYHSVPGDSNISSSEKRMLYFKHNLVISGIPASVRRSRGSDISASCGLLASGLR
ncbi:MAG: 23S rRNA (adenine(2503)-C(2))-methyltransferase RlmN [Bacteroidales bacterium]|nr:23S rRNA (adenine(2503)-C(2))-methyltransferase RlmN [Bacteroidales bacterium]